MMTELFLQRIMSVSFPFEIASLSNIPIAQIERKKVLADKNVSQVIRLSKRQFLKFQVN